MGQMIMLNGHLRNLRARRDAAQAIRECLAFLEQEAVRSNLPFVAHLIGAAALAAKEEGEQEGRSALAIDVQPAMS